LLSKKADLPLPSGHIQFDEFGNQYRIVSVDGRDVKQYLSSIRGESPDSVLAALTPSVAVWIDDSSGKVYKQVGDHKEEIVDEAQKKEIKDYLRWEEQSARSLFFGDSQNNILRYFD
jgi:ribonucleotide reductase alpha subunit